MAVSLSPSPILQFFGNNGAPLVGGSVLTQVGGVNAATYQDAAGTTALPNPIPLNSRGEISNASGISSQLYLTAGVTYTFTLYDGPNGTGNVISTSTNAGNVIPVSPSDGTYSFRNRLHNGNFSINQRAVFSGTLSAGAYAFDRWKAGAGGCTFTSAGGGADTVITITAGTLVQVVEDKNIEGGVYSLVNRGTAQARIAVNGAATSGVYSVASANAPLQSATATAGQTMTVEFTTGTVDRVQLEAGTVATSFERRPLSVELALCQRYFEVTSAHVRGSVGGAGGFLGAQSYFKVEKRAAPSLTATGTISSANVTAESTADIDTSGFRYSVQATAANTDTYVIGRKYQASADL